MHITVPTRSVPLHGLPPHYRRPGLGNGVSTACAAFSWNPNFATYAGVTSANQCPQPPSSAPKTGTIATEVEGLAMAAAPLTGPAAPFVALGAELASVLGIGKGCGAACIEASDIDNYAECVMHANIDTYMAIGPPRYQSQQTAALAVFDSAWSYIVQGCTQVGGTPGQNCISERQRGGKYDYFAASRDPIANDPCVVPDPTVAATVTSATTAAVSSASSAISSLLGGSSSMLLPLALLLGVAFVASEGMS
jgi:hypothetical protein